MRNENELLSIRTAIAASVIIEYCLRDIKEKHILKHRLSTVVNSCKTLRNYFNDKKNEWHRNEYVMLTELLKTCVVFDEGVIEEIIEAIKKNVNAEL
jgi:hypothetical protein